MNTQNYQPNHMQKEVLLPYYLQQHEITLAQLKNFSQKPNAAESPQLTMNSYLIRINYYWYPQEQTLNTQ